MLPNENSPVPSEMNDAQRHEAVTKMVTLMVKPLVEMNREAILDLALAVGPRMNSIVLQVTCELSAQVAKVARELAVLQDKMTPGKNIEAESVEILIAGIASLFKDKVNVTVARRLA